MTSPVMANTDEDTSVSLWIRFYRRSSSSPLLSPSTLRPLIPHRAGLYVSSLLCGRIVDNHVKLFHTDEEGRQGMETKDDEKQLDGEDVEHAMLVLQFHNRSAHTTFVNSPQYDELVDEKNLGGGKVSEVRLVDWEHLRYYSMALVSSSSRVELITAFFPTSERGLSSEMKRKVEEELIQLRLQGGAIVNWNHRFGREDGTDAPVDNTPRFVSPLKRGVGRGWVERCTSQEKEQGAMGSVMWILPYNGAEGERTLKETYTVSGDSGELVIDAFYRQLGEMGAVKTESLHVEFEKVQIPRE